MSSQKLSLPEITDEMLDAAWSVSSSDKMSPKFNAVKHDIYVLLEAALSAPLHDVAEPQEQKCDACGKIHLILIPADSACIKTMRRPSRSAIAQAILRGEGEWLKWVAQTSSELSDLTQTEKAGRAYVMADAVLALFGVEPKAPHKCEDCGEMRAAFPGDPLEPRFSMKRDPELITRPRRRRINAEILG